MVLSNSFYAHFTSMFGEPAQIFINREKAYGAELELGTLHNLILVAYLFVYMNY